MNRVIFVVGNRIQASAAHQVATSGSLTTPAFFLDLNSGTISENLPTQLIHTPRVTPWKIVQMRRTQLRDTDTIVLPQDVGLLQRVLAKHAHDSGARVVLLPDGVVSASALSNGTLLHRSVRYLVNATLDRLGIVAGAPGRMGASAPHVILSWGEGWRDSFSAPLSTQIVATGSPRFDELAQISPPSSGNRVLVCSQPLWIPQWSRPYLTQWYKFLEELTKQDKIDVRIRLHPQEAARHDLPPRVRAMNSGTSLAEDLAWATTVAAPFSSVLLDALAARRSVFALMPTASFEEATSQIPLFSDERLIKSNWSIDSFVSTASRKHTSQALTDTYLRNLGEASTVVAKMLSD